MKCLSNYHRWGGPWLALILLITPICGQTPSESFPNIIVDASARFVEAGMTQALDYQQEINDSVLGARVTGQGHTTGAMTAEMVPDSHRAAIRFNVVGRTDLQSIGRQRRVTVWGDGVTTFTAHKTISFDPSGFTSGASSSRALSDNVPRCVSAPPLIKSLAWRRLRRQRCEANRIVARHAEPLINERLDQDAQAIMQSANQAYHREFCDPLIGSNAFPQQVRFSTSSDELRVVILQATGDQTGAPQPALPFDLSHDLGIRLHETAFNNLADSLLAGKTLTDEQVRENVAKFLTMASLESFTPHETERPWSITFAKKNPVVVKFGSDSYTLIIAGDRWKSGRRSYRSKMNVSVTYRIDQSGDQVQLVRDDDVLIAPPGFVPGKSRLFPTTLSLRRVLQRKFDELFPETIHPDKLVVPGPWQQAGPLNVVRMAAEAGWLQMSWEMPVSPALATVDSGIE